MHFVHCLLLILVTKTFTSNIFFPNAPALFICQKIVVVFFWWFWIVIFRTRPFLLLLRLTSSQSMVLSWYSCDVPPFYVSSLFSRSSISVQHSHPCSRMDHKSDDYGAESDISVGKDGFHLGERVFRQNYSFLYFCVAFGILKPK